MIATCSAHLAVVVVHTYGTVYIWEEIVLSSHSSVHLFIYTSVLVLNIRFQFRFFFEFALPLSKPFPAERSLPERIFDRLRPEKVFRYFYEKGLYICIHIMQEYSDLSSWHFFCFVLPVHCLLLHSRESVFSPFSISATVTQSRGFCFTRRTWFTDDDMI